MTTLKRGDYCCPSTEAEWRSILDLAEALGVGLNTMNKYEWGRSSFIWYSHTSLHDGICEFNSLEGYDAYDRIEVPDFISGMYAMKEAREKKATGNDADFENHEQRLRKLESSDSFSKAGIFGPLDDLLERVWNLEKALNDRMVKERDCGGAQDYARSQSNTLHSLRNGGKQITFEIGDRKWFAVAHNNGVETLHAPHSGFPIIELEIKEQRP